VFQKLAEAEMRRRALVKRKQDYLDMMISGAPRSRPQD
jgi:hypothetical protein